MDSSAETSHHSNRPYYLPDQFVRFPRIRNRRFYSCMCCSNHILDVPFPPPWNNPNPIVRAPKRVICRAHQTVNVRFDNPENRRDYRGLPVLSVFCDQCNEQIGDRLISEDQGDDGTLLLFRKCLLFWDGEYTVYSDTLDIADVGNDRTDPH